MLLLTMLIVDWQSLLTILLGMAVLGPAQLLRAAAVLRRGPQARRGTMSRARGYLLAFLSVAATTLAIALLAAGLGGADEDASTFGAILSVVAILRLWPSGELCWSATAREAAHRRLKARFFGALGWAFAWSALCLLLASWLEGAFFPGPIRPRLLAGAFALLSADFHGEALQGCTRMLNVGQLPKAPELLEALSRPLSTDRGGLGLGRWLALTTLAQAAAHRQQGPMCSGARSRPSAGTGLRGHLPPLAAEVFSKSKPPPPPPQAAAAPPAPKPAVPAAPAADVPAAALAGPAFFSSGGALLSAPAGFAAPSPGFGFPPAGAGGAGMFAAPGQWPPPQQPFCVGGAAAVTMAAGSHGLVAAYLARYGTACLQMIRGLPLYRKAFVQTMARFERTVVTVLTVTGVLGWLQGRNAAKGPAKAPADKAPGVAAAGSRGFFAGYMTSSLEVMQEFQVRLQALAAAKGPAPTAAEAGVIELGPLAEVACSGLTGWVCLSRDLDEMGIVQREQGLVKLLKALCGVVSALADIPPLVASGGIQVSHDGLAVVRSVDEEVRHSMAQLVLTFERAGLKEVDLQPREKRIISDVTGC